MLNLRPITYIMGLLLVALGVSMLVPMLGDMAAGHQNMFVFLQSAAICIFVGGLLVLSSPATKIQRFSPQQSIFLSIGFWTLMPLFGMFPFILGAPEAGFTDAFFEAMSGFTTTGSTVFSSLETLPPSIKLWRAMMQWYGGIGIVITTMIFLPELRVGGMQTFRNEGFGNDDKTLPRLIEFAASMVGIYLLLTILCAITYAVLGMRPLDAITHAMTTLATGGFGNYDTSFMHFPAQIIYAASLFMLLAALPFIRYVQVSSEGLNALLREPQIKAFLLTFATITVALVFVQIFTSTRDWEPAIRHALFNTISLLSGTGYVSDDYNSWGGFGILILFFAGLIGGCAGSTTCSIKIFRYQILFASLRTQIQKLIWPNGVFLCKYNGKKIDNDIINSVAVFFILFLLSLTFLAFLLALSGLDYITAISGAAAALANIGPGFGEHIGPMGNFSTLNDVAKWLLICGMLLGRLELITVYVLFIRSFWQR